MDMRLRFPKLNEDKRNYLIGLLVYLFMASFVVSYTYFLKH